MRALVSANKNIVTQGEIKMNTTVKRIAAFALVFALCLSLFAVSTFAMTARDDNALGDCCSMVNATFEDIQPRAGCAGLCNPNTGPLSCRCNSAGNSTWNCRRFGTSQCPGR